LHDGLDRDIGRVDGYRVNPLLQLIGDLYGQLTALQAENATLREQLAAATKEPDSGAKRD
jgi:hypothetical protein